MGDEAILQIGKAIYDSLRFMDKEATTSFSSSDGEWPSGLRQYHKHYQQEFGGSFGCEPAWSQRLAILLMRDFGVNAKAEKPYPGYAATEQRKSKATCDLVVDLEQSERFWIEVKGSWPNSFGWKNGRIVDRGFSRHVSYLHSDTANDFRKLDTLRQPDAHWKGVLLIGFDTPARSLDAKVQEMVQKNCPDWGSITHPGWVEPHSQYAC